MSEQHTETISPLDQPKDKDTADIPDTPQLTTYTATSHDDVISALRLVADSVAQQRQIAAKSIIFHPLWLGVMGALLAVIFRVFYHDRSDLPLIATTGAGCLMAGLVVVRFLTGGYIELAEKVGTWEWLEAKGEEEEEEEEEDRVVLVTKFGEKIIGALVLRGVRTGEKKERKQLRRGEIRAWTVLQRYRGQGVGRDLLERAVEICGEKGWEGLVFDQDHANSNKPLPGMFNERFERRERRARDLLMEIMLSRK